MTTRLLTAKVHATTIKFEAEIQPEEGGFRAIARGRFMREAAAPPSAWGPTENEACDALEHQLSESLSSAVTDVIREQGSAN